MIKKHLINSAAKEQNNFRRFLLPLLLSLLFYGVMLFLTFFAEDLHDALLPKVTALPLSKQEFTYEVKRSDGSVRQVTKALYALPAKLVDSGLIFELVQSKKNDQPYYTVRRITTLKFGRLQNDYYEITNPNGLYSIGNIIMSGYEQLEDGDEVFWLREKK